MSLGEAGFDTDINLFIKQQYNVCNHPDFTAIASTISPLSQTFQLLQESSKRHHVFATTSLSRQIEKLGYTVTGESKTYISFEFKGHPVKLFPYSGWHTGKTIQDGRGLKNLLDQIK